MGRWSLRFRAGLWFLSGGTFFAFYSGIVSHLRSLPALESSHAWDELDKFFGVMSVVLLIPIEAIVAMLMLRSWIWSAHDQNLRLELRHGNNNGPT